MGEYNQKQQIYLDIIQPKLQEILSICNTHQIPMFTAFGFDEWDEEMADPLTSKKVKAAKASKLKLALAENVFEEKEFTEDHIFKYMCLLPEMVNLKVRNNYFAKFVNVINGFDTVAKYEPDNYNMDDFVLDDFVSTNIEGDINAD